MTETHKIMMSPRGPTLPPQRQIWTQRIHSHRTAEQQTDTSDTMGGRLCYLGTFVLTDGSRNPRPDENGFRNFNSTNATWWTLFMNIYFDPSFLYFTRSSPGPSLQFQMTLFELRLSFSDCAHFSTGRFFTLLAVNFCSSACRNSQILRFMQKLSQHFSLQREVDHVSFVATRGSVQEQIQESLKLCFVVIRGSR